MYKIIFNLIICIIIYFDTQYLIHASIFEKDIFCKKVIKSIKTKKTQTLIKNRKNIIYINIKNMTQVIMPIMINNKKNKLWEKNNIWFKSWKIGCDKYTKKISFRIPLGDMQDRILFPISKIKNRSISKENIYFFLKRYNVSGIFISYLENKKSILKISLYHIQPKSRWSKIGKFKFLRKYNPIYLQKVKKEVVFITNQWAKGEKNKLIKKKKIIFIISINSFFQWQKIQMILKKLPSIDKIKMKYLSLTHAKMEIIIKNNKYSLNKKISQSGWYILPSSINSEISTINSLKFYIHQEIET